MSCVALHDETSLQPLTPQQVYDPLYWRRRAVAARRLARGVPTADAAVSLERAAADFERLAERAAALQEAEDAAA